jgi:NAD(H)-dependent 7beta-hydroxy-3-oxo-delta4-cholenoic acid oxidoreductase
VLVVGKINDIKYANFVVENGFSDAIVIGRPLLADPELPNKAMEGRFEDIAPCGSCCGPCITRNAGNIISSCVINPALCREKAMAITPADIKKKVLIIGGGPAGLETARVAALRGHDVTIFEKSNKLGGQLILAIIPPFKQDMSKWIKYLVVQVKKTGVNIQLNTQGTEESIKAQNPDVIVIATGSKPVIPPIKGIENIAQITGRDILSYKKLVLGGKNMIIGGRRLGLEIAETLYQNAIAEISIHVVEMLGDVCIGLTPHNRTPLLQRLHAYGLEISTSTKVVEFGENSVTVEKDGKTEVLYGYKNIIFCSGVSPENDLYELLKDSYKDISITFFENGVNCHSITFPTTTVLEFNAFVGV